MLKKTKPKKNRFKHRWIVVTENAHIVSESTYHYRSFETQDDAVAAVCCINSKSTKFQRGFIVDRDNMENIILP